jgi:hypothetical protein
MRKGSFLDPFAVWGGICDALLVATVLCGHCSRGFATGNWLNTMVLKI